MGGLSLLTTISASTTTGTSPALPVVMEQDSLDLLRIWPRRAVMALMAAKMSVRARVPAARLRMGTVPQGIPAKNRTVCADVLSSRYTCINFLDFLGGFCHRPWGRHVAARLPRGQSTGIRASVPWSARISCSVDSRITDHRHASRTPLVSADMRA